MSVRLNPYVRFLTAAAFVCYFFIYPSFLNAAVTDNPIDLIVPDGDTYILDGAHSYSGSIRIDGTLFVAAYSSGGATGILTLAASSMTVSATGRIIADGRGYPAGSGPGKGVDAYHPGGGSYGGIGGGSTGPVYGSFVDPIDPGSGGGYEINISTLPGGAGGGVVRFAVSGGLTIDGVVSAVGEDSPNFAGGGGSGGSINITAAGLTGSGAIKADGGRSNYNGGGGGGRVAISASDNAFTGVVTAYGGVSVDARSGGPGTVFINGVLTVDNNGLAGNTEVYEAGHSNPGISKFIIRSGAIVDLADTVVLDGGMEITAATVTVNKITVGTLLLNNGGVMSPKEHQVALKVNGTMTVHPGGIIQADGKGYPAGSGPGKGLDAPHAGGGSYGGIGGGSTGPGYGSFVNPVDLGSAGGYQTIDPPSPGGAGGGAVRLAVSGGLTIDGVVSAIGADSPNFSGGGGSGGSINVTAAGLTGSGVIKADGGRGLSYNGGGGGGRVAILAPGNAFTGAVTAYGGISAEDHPGGSGSVLINSVLTFDNGGVSGVLGYADIAGINYSAAEISKIIVKSGAMVSFSTGMVLESALEIAGATVTVDDTLTIGRVTVSNGGVIAPEQHKIDLIVRDLMTIAAGGMVLADGKGYPAGNGPGKGKDTKSGGGGSYGGQGGGSDLPPYGSLINPMDPGSGGGYAVNGSSYPGGSGGGFIKLSVSGDLTLDGVVSANGNSEFYGGGGSGGGINIASGRLLGSGAIKADANYIVSTNGGGGGGGGRVAIYYGQKIFAGNITALGGGSARGFYGENGSIVDNGTIIASGKFGPGESITAPAQTIGSTRHLIANISEETMSFNNLTASGTFNGSVGIPRMVIVKINSGAYAGKGFARGELSAILGGKSYQGGFEGSVSRQGGAMSIRGMATGDIYGSVELDFMENAPGSGIYNRVGGLINCNRIGENTLVKIFVSGVGVHVSGQDYPSVRFDLAQTAVQGNMTGSYAGPFNAIFTGLTIDEPSSPYNGEGYSLASYSTDKGEAPGWAYARRLQGGIITVSGILDSPLYAIIQGVFNSDATPPKYILNTEKLDNALLALKVKTLHPYGVSPGGTYSFGIEVDNQGTKTFENMSVVVVPSPHMEFVSASSTYTLYSSVYWTDDKYDPIPCIRWDFPQITPGRKINLSYELKARVGVMTDGEMMKGNVYVLPTQDALDFLPGYDDEGPMDDDVIEDADMPADGSGERIEVHPVY